jgi:hypothetical protein
VSDRATTRNDPICTRSKTPSSRARSGCLRRSEELARDLAKGGRGFKFSNDQHLELTDIVYTSGSLERQGEPMTERELSRAAARRLAIIRHAEE